jgi:hypothetical protein
MPTCPLSGQSSNAMTTHSSLCYARPRCSRKIPIRRDAHSSVPGTLSQSAMDRHCPTPLSGALRSDTTATVQGPGFVLCPDDFIVDQYFPIVERLEEASKHWKSASLVRQSVETTTRIYQLKRACSKSSGLSPR